jgi:hypothetical protein
MKPFSRGLNRNSARQARPSTHFPTSDQLGANTDNRTCHNWNTIATALTSSRISTSTTSTDSLISLHARGVLGEGATTAVRYLGKLKNILIPLSGGSERLVCGRD